MTGVLELPVDAVVERVEAAMAAGDRAAGRLLDVLLEELERTGGLGVMSRLAASRHLR